MQHGKGSSGLTAPLLAPDSASNGGTSSGGDGADTQPRYRTVLPNQPAQQQLQEFADNVVITSHYTAATFVPVFLFEQFTRFANAYFLLVSVLQMIPAVSITNGIPSSMVPLSFVILFDAIVTAREDYKRHVDDAKDNAHPTLVLAQGEWRKTPWRDVRVGDIVKVVRGDTFPADLLFLRATTDDGAAPEACYVQTAQLDGETNLKLRTALAATVDAFPDESALASYRGAIRAEPPNGIFGRFAGTIELEEGGDPLPLEADQILLRGCVLRNVEYVFGVVIYTGTESKVRVKQTDHKRKRAQVEHMVNKQITFLVALLVLVCVVGTIGYAVWTNGQRGKAWYLQVGGVGFGDSILRLLTFFLLNSNFIPVSLYVSMKLARTAQKFFMEHDLQMYFEDADLVEASGGAEGRFPMQVRSMDLNDELGQISHIFSDKTGTFTLNYMEFRKVCINGVSYGRGTTEIGLDRMRREHVAGVEELAREMAEHDAGGRAVPHVNFADGSDSHPGRSLRGDLDRARDEGVGEPGSTTYFVHTFMLHLALNHTVVPEKIRNDAGEVVDTRLSASSPDEEAFVRFGEFMGYRFEGRTTDSVRLCINDEVQEFTVLHILAYNQVRKRMSVVVRDATGALRLYVKGADTVVMARLADGAVPDDVRRATEKHLITWGNDGLRTLCFAYRDLDEETYSVWCDKYLAARGSVEEIEKRKQKQPNRIDDLMDELEQRLTLHGATANEDKLQPGVPDTIATLALAGIKLWMLTGDKVETAINISYACKLLTSSMHQLVLTMEQQGSMDAVLKALRDFSLRDFERIPLALIIDEQALDAALGDAGMRDKLLEVSCACDAVVCCRARPDQKAAMVSLIRGGVPSARTLAIGDGANDVDMIQTAHVGVGIAGAEGVQAANASDYAIGRFRFLKRLLLVHGRANYRRISKLVCYMFYKNILMTLVQMLYAGVSGWSGQKLFVELALQSFNLIYTGPAVLMLAVFDHDVEPRDAETYPQLYKVGPRNTFFALPVFAGWIASAVLESVIIFLVCIWGLETPAATGESFSIFELGGIMFSVVVTVVNIRVALETHLHHWTYSAVIFLSIASWWLCSYIFSLLDANGTFGVTAHMYGSSTAWFTMALATWLCIVRIVAWKLYKRNFRSQLRHVVQEAALVTRDRHKLDAWAQRKRKEAQTTQPQYGAVGARAQVGTGTQGASAGESKSSDAMLPSHPQHPRPQRQASMFQFSSHTGADFSHDDSHAEYHADKLSRHGSASGYHMRRRAMTVLSAIRRGPPPSTGVGVAALPMLPVHQHAKSTP